MQFIKDNKKYILFIVLAALGYWAYTLYSGGSAPEELLSSGEESPISQDLLVTLSSLHTIRLDAGIFTDPVFVSLSDFGVQIPAEAVGRRNPFAPL